MCLQFKQEYNNTYTLKLQSLHKLNKSSGHSKEKDYSKTKPNDKSSF